jgi:hypothetical protein
MEAVGHLVLQTLVPDLWINREAGSYMCRQPLGFFGPCSRLGLGVPFMGDSELVRGAYERHVRLGRLCHELVAREPTIRGGGSRATTAEFPTADECDDPYQRARAWYVTFATLVLDGRQEAVDRYGERMVDFVSDLTLAACSWQFSSREGCRLPEGLDRR